MRTSWLASTFLTLGVALSCSVLNAPEDLITSIAGSGGQGGDSGGGDGGSAGDSGTGSNSNTGSGGDPSFMPSPPTTGLLVLAARDGDGDRVLSVLSTEDGSELHR